MVRTEQTIHSDSSSNNGNSSYVEIDTITKNFGGLTAVDDLSFSLSQGDFLTLLGPSGCGKTTTLRIIAGLEEPDQGSISIQNTPITDQPSHERNIGMVFQHYALFPHKTVGENIEFPLKMRGKSKQERKQRAKEVLDLVQLPNKYAQSPKDLSGGQQQRVALARALVFEPDLLLMDEPLSALDRVLRQELRIELKRIQRETGITTIYVTHDQLEAFSLSDQIIILKNGRLSQKGAPTEIYEKPSTGFVADFVGQSTKIEGVIKKENGKTLLENETMEIELPNIDCTTGMKASVFLRAEKLNITKKKNNLINEFPVKILVINYLGEKTQFVCEMNNGKEIIVSKQGFTDLKNYSYNDKAYLNIPQNQLTVVPEGDNP